MSKFDSKIGVKYKVYNSEKDKIFRLSFNSAIDNAKYYGKVCYGVKELEMDYQEVVSQEWVCLTNEKKALNIINFGNYGSRTDGKKVDITLMHSPAYTVHPIGERKILPEDRFMARTDQGERDFEFIINGGDGQNILDNADFNSIISHQKPIVLNYFPTGFGEVQKTNFKIDNSKISISCMKKSKDGCLILRLFNSTFSLQSANITYKKTIKNISLKPLEFLTLKISETNMKNINILEE